MTRKPAKRLSLTLAALLISAAWVRAGDHLGNNLRTPSYRPYIIEVGPPHPIDRLRITREMQLNSDLRSFIKDYGYPEVAEIQEVVPEYGWSDYEIRAFYLSRNQEIAFGRVAFFPRHGDPSFIDDYGLIKYQGPIQADVKRLQGEIRVCGGSSDSSLDRILAAAERTERAEAESLRAQQSAAKAEAVGGRMEAGFSKSLRK